MSYETYLSENDPATRREHGVWYTPEPIVSYIVRSVDIILKTKLHCPLGFADDVRVIDPAAGEGTFLLKAMEMAMPDGDPDGFVGYELLPTPCDTANTRSRELLASYGMSVDHDMFINKNTLEDNTQSTLCDTVIPTERAKKRVCAVIGNPPYKLSKINRGLYDKETDLYKAGLRVDKDGLRREKNFMNLSADYVKFIRFAHKQIDDQGEGVIGFITNNSYLSGLIHRGMRKELLKSFDEIYILNLHGHAGVDPSNDKNIFDIKQGVSIAVFVKTTDSIDDAKVYYSELIGSRESKYDYLADNDINTTEWIELETTCPYFFFEAKDFSAQDGYNTFVHLFDIFNNKSTGIITSRDAITIQKTETQMKNIVSDFNILKINEVRIRYNLPEETDTNSWNVYNAMKGIKDMIKCNKFVSKILYRPFDARYTYHPDTGGGFMHNPRCTTMQHMQQDNIALLGIRQYTNNDNSVYNHVFATDKIINGRVFTNNRGLCEMMPLYLYTNNTRTPNINPNIITTLTTTYNTIPTPEDIFYYIYGILHSTTYRQKYAELLKIDFPKIPFTTDHDMFMRIGAIGERLADIHLMKPDVFNHSIIEYHGSGENRIDKVSYDESTHRVYINKTQYFDMIPPEVWNCQIGGYRPSKKWLDDRRHDVLTSDDIDHYRYIGHALKKTMELQTEIDMIYDDIDKDVITW